MRKLEMLLLAVLVVAMVGGAAWAAPAAPTVSWPTASLILGSNRPDITWTGDAHSAFEIHVGTNNTPSSTNGWASGTVWSTGNTWTCGALSPQTTYYVFVRLYDSSTGWGPWSAYGVNFYVDGQFLNDPYMIAGTGLEWWDSIAYNPDRNEYCVTWQNGYVIHWRRLDSTGTAIGSDYVLSDGVTVGHHFSQVCYNNSQHEYLLLYSGWLGDNSDQLRVQRVDAVTGNQIGSSIWLYSTGGISTTGGICLAYSPTSNSYLAAYEAYSEGGIVYSQLLNTTGNPVGAHVRVSPVSQQYSRNPAMAWNSTSNEFMVTYQGYIADPTWDYWAQRVRASDGALLGSNLAITTGHDSGPGGVAYDPVMDRYLVVREGGASSPTGQFVSSTATLIGSQFSIGSGNFVGWGPSVCWDSSKHEFLASWSATLSYDCFARRVSETGACVGETIRPNGDWLGIGNWPPQPVYNSVNDEFLIHWYNSYADILDRRYKSYALPGADATPPGAVTSFTATAGSGQVTLNWHNPSDTDFSGTMIRYKTTGYPTSRTDGSLACNQGNTPGSNDSFVHTSLNNGTTYYYAAYSYDEVPNYCATAAQANAAPQGPPATPSITSPAGDALTGVTPTIQWTSDTHDQYQVRVSQRSDYNTTLNGWDSGTVNSSGNSATCGTTLGNYSVYYAFVRVHNSYGWGPWSSARRFVTNTDSNYGNIYFGVVLPSSASWAVYDGTYENGGGITSDNILDGDSMAWRLYDNSATNRCKERYQVTNVSFDTGASIESRMRATSVSGTPTYNLGISNGGVGGMFLRLYTNQVMLVDINGTNRGTYSLDATIYHRYRLTVKNATTGNNATAVWRVYIDGTERINWTGAGVDNGFDGFMAGHAGTTATGYWYFDWIACRADGEFTPAQWLPFASEDITPPAQVTNFQDTSGDQQVLLTWHNPSDSDFSGTMIRYRTDTYPSDVNDGTLVCDRTASPGSDDSFTHTGLTNFVTYYYSAFAYDTAQNYAAAKHTDATPCDNAAPANVTSFVATSGDTQTTLSWANPGDSDFAGTRVVFKTSGYPSGPSDGTQIYSGTGTGTTHTGLTNGLTYYYTAFAFDEVPNFSSGAQASVVPADVTPPGPVTGFVVTPGGGQNALSWTNPGGDFTGTKIMFKTTGYPTGPADGTSIYDGSGTSVNHTGLTNGVTYYYCAYSHDEVPNYGSAAQATGAPHGGTINVKSAANLNLVIDGNSGDWNLGTDFTTKTRGGMGETGDYAIVGYDGGTCYYGSYAQDGVLPTNAADHTAKVYTRHDQQCLYFLVRCDDSDMQYPNSVDMNWANDCVEFYIDPSHDHGSSALSNSTSDIQLVIDCNNQKNVYCTTTGYATQVLSGVTSAVVRDGTGWWLEAKILKSVLDPDVPSGGTYGTDFNFRDNDNNNDPTQSTVYSWSEFSTAGYPSKIPDHWGDASLATLAADTTAPAAVTGFSATPSMGQNGLVWTNPATMDWTGTQVRFKTTSYPTGPADGTQCYNGIGTSYNHTGLTGGVTYYYCAYSYDEVPNYASAVQAIGTPPDTTPPGDVTGFAAASGDTQNVLTWANPGDSDLAGVKIMFKTTSYPTSQSDGTQCYSGMGTTTTHTGLTNGTTYYYKAFAFDAVPNYSSGSQASAIPADVTAPGNVTGFTATPASAGVQINLSWSNPGDSDLAGVKIMFKTTGYPTSQSDGTQCYNSNGTSYNHTGLTNGVTYYYKAFPYDEVPNYASGAQASATAADTQAPSNVTSFTAAPVAAGGQINLSWSNPGSDFTGTKIVFKTTGYPTSTSDGTSIYDSNGTSYNHTGLTNGVTYYYKAFAHDAVPNYAGGVTASATPYGFCDFFSYSDGNLNGNGGWSGSATNQIQISSQTVKINGGATLYDATKTTNCGDQGGGIIWVRCKIQKGSGADTVWDLYINDSSGRNFARWYGTGATARGRIGGTANVTAVQNLTAVGTWDNIDVKITLSGQTAQFFFNGTSIGTLGYSSEGTGSAVGQLKFDRANNSAASGEYVYFDNLTIGGN